jgi:hypothetical protein
MPYVLPGQVPAGQYSIQINPVAVPVEMGSASLHSALIYRPTVSGGSDRTLLEMDGTQPGSGGFVLSLDGNLPALDAGCGDQLVLQLAATGDASFLELTVSGSLP